MRSVTSSTPFPANGCSPDTISCSITHRDQTSSASSAGRPDSTSGDSARCRPAHGAAPRGGSVAGLASETEVEELGRPVRREPDVARLDVACMYPASCRAARASARRAAMSTPRAAGTGPRRSRSAARGAAGQELDNEKRAVPPRLDAVDVRDGRMVDGRHGPRLRLSVPSGAGPTRPSGS